MVFGFIGVVHLPPMPGDPLASPNTTFDSTCDFALADAEALVEGGVNGIILENFGSSPFPKGDAQNRLPAHQVATLARIAHLCKERFDIPIGVNCLRNDAHSAIGIAAATHSNFVRVNIHTSTFVTDQGVIEGEAHSTLRYRRALGATDIKILADVLVKHAQPLVPLSPRLAAEDTVNRGHADGLIVSGSGTGKPADRGVLEEVLSGAHGRPVLLGSGLNFENAATYCDLIDGAICGTALKTDGVLSAPVDPVRVRKMADILLSHWA